MMHRFNIDRKGTWTWTKRIRNKIHGIPAGKSLSAVRKISRFRREKIVGFWTAEKKTGPYARQIQLSLQQNKNTPGNIDSGHCMLWAGKKAFGIVGIEFER